MFIGRHPRLFSLAHSSWRLSPSQATLSAQPLTRSHPFLNDQTSLLSFFQPVASPKAPTSHIKVLFIIYLIILAHQSPIDTFQCIKFSFFHPNHPILPLFLLTSSYLFLASRHFFPKISKKSFSPNNINFALL